MAAMLPESSSRHRYPRFYIFKGHGCGRMVAQASACGFCGAVVDALPSQHELTKISVEEVSFLPVCCNPKVRFECQSGQSECRPNGTRRHPRRRYSNEHLQECSG